MQWRVALLGTLALVLITAPALALSPVILFFESGSARLDSRATEIVDYAARFIQRADVRAIEIVGNADSVGLATDNIRLSRRRAEAVHTALLARGMPRHIGVTITAAGETRPIGATGDGVADPENRNVQILFMQLCTEVDGTRLPSPRCEVPLPD